MGIVEIRGTYRIVTLKLSFIKPHSNPPFFQLKIADFGFARFLNDEDMAATLCGSPIYMVTF